MRTEAFIRKYGKKAMKGRPGRVFEDADGKKGSAVCTTWKPEYEGHPDIFAWRPLEGGGDQ